MALDPHVSIIVPTYNCEKYISECIESVLKQSFHDLELICVDDCSTDSTCEIIKKYALNDNRITLLHQIENQGPGVARNVGIAHARGKYIYCLDADDYLRHNTMADVTLAMDVSGADMAIVPCFALNDQCGRVFPAGWSRPHLDKIPSYPKGTFSWEDHPEIIFEVVQTFPWNKIVTRSLLEENDIRFQEIRLTEDLMYSLPAGVCAKKIIRMPQPGVYHREFSGTNAMSDKGKHPLDFLYAFEAFQGWLRSKGLYPELRHPYRIALLDAIYYNMLSYRNLDDFIAAYDYLTQDDLNWFDLADMRVELVDDIRFKVLLDSLQHCSREELLLRCLNVKTAELDKSNCEQQERSSLLRWSLGRARDYVRR